MKVPIAVLVPPDKGHCHRSLGVTAALSLLTSISWWGAVPAGPEAPGPALSWERRVRPPSRPPGRPARPPSALWRFWGAGERLACPSGVGPACCLSPRARESGFVVAPGLPGAAAAFTSGPCCPVEAEVPSEQVPSSSSNEQVKALLGRFLRDTCLSHCFFLLTTAVGAEPGQVSGWCWLITSMLSEERP